MLGAQKTAKSSVWQASACRFRWCDRRCFMRKLRNNLEDTIRYHPSHQRLCFVHAMERPAFTSTQKTSFGVGGAIREFSVSLVEPWLGRALPSCFRRALSLILFARVSLLAAEEPLGGGEHDGMLG